MIRCGQQVLRSRYQLVSGPLGNEDTGQSWIGVDEDDTTYLVKIWPFEGDRPDDLQRALWDAELRTLYRVGSSPGADDSIVVLRDAGVDRDARCFVMALKAPGYETLASALRKRSDIPWLAGRDLPSRRALWTGLARLAAGIRLLHEQNVLHRDVNAETVYFDSELAASSLRLGGFEWSIRLGTPDTKAPPPTWSSPPEFFSGGSFGYRPETDWFAFGMLAIRTLLNVESYGTNEPQERHRRVLKELERSGGRLTDLERTFLLRLIAGEPRERITRGYEILTAIEDTRRALEQGADPRADARPLVVVINQGANLGLLDRALELGFLPDPDKPMEAFNPNNILHTANLTSFVQQDLVEPQLYAVPGAEFFILVGQRLILMLTQFEYLDRDRNNNQRTWDFAFSPRLGELRWNEGGAACVDLPRTSVVVRTKHQVRSDRGIRQNSRSWEPILPQIDQTAQLRTSLARFHEFIRCTNQIELLIRDSEIFSYRLLNHTINDGVERIVISEAPRARQPLRFCRVEGGLTEFLLREIESGKKDCRLAVLTGPSEDALILPTIEKAECWTVDNVKHDEKRIELSRVGAGKKGEPPDAGTIRTWGMFGQVALIRRRKRAIDRIEKHAYLLLSLSSPGQAYMDTGAMPLPVHLPPEMVDEAKQAAIQDILRVRPIYALQGPPGTGKTTLVAHLLRQIFEDDPVAQVLITAQAHGAVDVLRAKVRHEAFRDVPDEQQPLAVRLGLGTDGPGLDPGSVEDVSLDILQRARSILENSDDLTDLQEQWLAAVSAMEGALKTLTPEKTAPDFCEVVKRGANITYCTTSAGDLETLADAVQSFDWAIVEEAGKAHGFDLALPLQAGHRWLLIGDHKQLPPYRFKDYRDGIDALDEVVNALEELPERAGNLLDYDWVRSWRDLDIEKQASFKEYARSWLATFERVFESCTTAPGGLRLTVDAPVGAAAGMLSRQHRMHPTIGDLISAAYYTEHPLVNRTVDDEGQPLDRVRHHFVEPAGVGETALVWLDVPWCAREARCAEVGPSTGRPRYSNPSEVSALASFIAALRQRAEGSNQNDLQPLTLAVLSPYNQQVNLINQRLDRREVESAGLNLKPALRGRRTSVDANIPVRIAHTVDSFQGNQADIIAVSLVRNNQLEIGAGLGFLDEAPRINVLLSRAERLLVLVGSWEFFKHQLQAVTIDDPQLPLWHWKKVLATLDEFFKSGRAARLSVEDTARELRK